MARVLLASELGTADSLLRRALPLALALRDFGHEPLLMVTDLPKAEALLGEHGLRLLQCPLWRSRVSGLPPVHTYTDLMLRCGFAQAQGLRSLARAWRDLVELLRPALLVLDHAPVALFATRAMRLPRLRYGDGFGCPPLTTPMPSMTWWDDTPEPFDTIGERNALHVANQVAVDLNLPAARSIAELLRAEGEALCTLPELDPYPQRQGGQYCGVLRASTEGVDTPWPGGESASCFVALGRKHPCLATLVDALQAAGLRAVLQVPGCTPEQAQALTAQGIVVARTPVPVAQVLRHCSHAVVDGHPAIAQALLLAGKPLLLLPTMLEQRMLAQRVRDLGLGLMAEASSSPDGVAELAKTLRRLIDEPGWTEAAQDFAGRHAEQSDRRTLALVLAQCDDLMAAALG